MSNQIDYEERAITRQYLHGGGFCDQCGEACQPFIKNLPKDVIETACIYNGSHPNCGNHKMIRTLKASETLGNYEVWECTNEDCDWGEAC